MERFTQKPKVVFLDWYATLSSSLFWEQLQDKDHPAHEAHQKIQKGLFEELKGLIEPWMRGEFTAEQIVEKLSQVSGLNEQFLLGTLVESCQTMKYTSEKILPLVKELREKDIKVVIATDNMDTFTRWTAPAMNLDNHFDKILNSYDLGVLKKDADNENKSKFFAQYLNALNLPRANALMFDDAVDKEGVITNAGVTYVQIPKHTGLEPALQELILRLGQSSS